MERKFRVSCVAYMYLSLVDVSEAASIEPAQAPERSRRGTTLGGEIG